MPKRLNRRIADPQTGHDCYSEDSAQQALLAALQAHHFPNQAMGAMSDRAVDPGNGLRSQIPPYCCTRRSNRSACPDSKDLGCYGDIAVHAAFRPLMWVQFEAGPNEPPPWHPRRSHFRIDKLDQSAPCKAPCSPVGGRTVGDGYSCERTFIHRRTARTVAFQIRKSL